MPDEHFTITFHTTTKRNRSSVPFSDPRGPIVRAIATAPDEAWQWIATRILFPDASIGGFLPDSQVALLQLRDLVREHFQMKASTRPSGPRPPER